MRRSLSALKKGTAQDQFFKPNVEQTRQYLHSIIRRREVTSAYDDLVRLLKELRELDSALLSEENNPIFRPFFETTDFAARPISNLISNILQELHQRMGERVEYYCRQYRNKSEPELFKIIEDCKKILKHSSILESEIEAQLHAARIILHPHFQVVAVAAGCVPDVMVLKKAAAQGYETLVLLTEDRLSQPAAQIADHVIRVCSASDFKEHIQKIHEFLEKRNIKRFHAAYDVMWGLNSENYELPEYLEHYNQQDIRSKIVFVGPGSKPMKKFSDKWSLNRAAIESGVPVIPGYYGDNQDRATLIQEVIKYSMDGTCMVKSIGGGGSGNTEVNNPADAAVVIDRVKERSPGCNIIVTQKLQDPVHIEYQVLCFRDAPLIVGRRRCSIQTSNGQKYIEESTIFSGDTPMDKDALKLAEKMWQEGYRGACTIEFLVQIKEGKESHAVLEANTRLQVEHYVTELVLGGLNLIDARYWAAANFSAKDFLIHFCKSKNLNWENKTLENLMWTIIEASPIKYAVQARLNAEDFVLIHGEFLRFGTEGYVHELKLPAKNVFSGIKGGSCVNTKDRSQIIALIYGVSANSHKEALEDLLNQLKQTHVGGIPTNQQLLETSLREWLKNYDNLPINTATARKFEEEYAKKPKKSEEPEERLMHSIYHDADHRALPSLLWRATRQSKEEPFSEKNLVANHY